VWERIDSNSASVRELISSPADKLSYHFLGIIGETIYCTNLEVCIFTSKLFNLMADEKPDEQLEALFKKPMIEESILAARVNSSALHDIVTCWPTKRHLENFLQLRTAFTLNLFDEALEAVTHKSDHNELGKRLKLGIDLGCKCFSDLAAIDAETETYEEWEALWQKLLENAQDISLLFDNKTPEEWDKAHSEIRNHARRTATPFLNMHLAKDQCAGCGCLEL
jgi:hypothetical protein